MNKKLLSVFIIFIALMTLSLHANAARLVAEEEVRVQEKAQQITEANEHNNVQPEVQPESTSEHANAVRLVAEEEVKVQEKAQQITEANEYNNVQPEVQPESQPANLEATTNNDIDQEIDSKASDQSTIYWVVLIALLVGLIIGGAVLRSYISATYNYDIFSLGKIVMGCVAIIMLVLAFYSYIESKMITSDVQIMLGIAALIYVLMLIVNIKNSSFIMAILALFYQILLSGTVVFIILIIILMIYGRRVSKKKEGL